MRPAQGGLSDRRTAFHFLSILSFTSSSASCALSIAESSLPLFSWCSPSRLVSSSPVTAPTACFARPSILSVVSPMADLLGTSGLWPRHVALGTTSQTKKLDCGVSESLIERPHLLTQSLGVPWAVVS